MRRRHRKFASSPDLDITPFMNLMIVLVPVLLLGMVFSQVRMIELNFPGQDSGEAPAPEQLKLVVTLIPEGMEVADSNLGVIRALPVNGGEQDFRGLREVLQQIKRKVPEKTDIVLEVGAVSDFEYELQMGYANASLKKELETVYLMPSLEHAFVSSSVVRSILNFDGKIAHLVPAEAFKLIKCVL